MERVTEIRNAKACTKRKNKVKPKGDRLGWTSRSEVKHTPLRDIVGEGRIVSESCCFISVNTKMIM